MNYAIKIQGKKPEHRTRHNRAFFLLGPWAFIGFATSLLLLGHPAAATEFDVTNASTSNETTNGITTHLLIEEIVISTERKIRASRGETDAINSALRALKSDSNVDYISELARQRAGLAKKRIFSRNQAKNKIKHVRSRRKQ